MSNASSSNLPLTLLPQLPVELLRQITESSVPSHYHSSTYSRRQSTLRHLCLTSRLFRKLAQPLLEEFDQLSLTHVGADIEPDQERNNSTRVLSVAVRADRALGSVEPIVLNYSNLEELHIYANWQNYSYVDASRLVPLSCRRHRTSLLDLGLTTPHILALTDLTISWTDAKLSSPTTVLPSIRYLTLYRTGWVNTGPLLRPSILPSLRILALLYAPPRADIVNFAALLSQLEFLIATPCVIGGLQRHQGLMEEHGHKIVMDVRYNEISYRTLSTVQHVRIRVTPGEMVEERSKYSPQELETRRDDGDEEWMLGPNSEGHLREAFNWFCDSRGASEIPYKTLFLDQGLYKMLESFEGMQDKYNHIVEMCEKDGTEVVLEEQPVSKSADSAITPELLRWIDRRKENAQVGK